MMQLSEEQLNNLNKDALILLVESFQDQLTSMLQQLDYANSLISNNNHQIELLTEQIRIMNQRHFGKSSENSLNQIDRQLTLFDSFNEIEATCDSSFAEPEISRNIISSYKRSKTQDMRNQDLDGLPTSIIEHTLSKEELDKKFPHGYLLKSIKDFVSFPKHSLLMNIIYTCMHQRIMMV